MLKGSPHGTNRNTARIVGALFIIGTVAGVLSILEAPLALQEMVLAVWLIVKGFSPAAIASGAEKQL